MLDGIKATLDVVRAGAKLGNHDQKNYKNAKLSNHVLYIFIMLSAVSGVTCALLPIISLEW